MAKLTTQPEVKFKRGGAGWWGREVTRTLWHGQKGYNRQGLAVLAARGDTRGNRGRWSHMIYSTWSRIGSPGNATAHDRNRNRNRATSPWKSPPRYPPRYPLENRKTDSLHFMSNPRLIVRSSTVGSPPDATTTVVSCIHNASCDPSTEPQNTTPCTISKVLQLTRVNTTDNQSYRSAQLSRWLWNAGM